MLQRQGQKLRRLSNLFGCRDPEYVSPERSRSATPSDPASGQSHGEPFEDEDVGVVTQDVGVLTQEVWPEVIYPIVDALLTISSHTVFPYLLLMHRLLMI